MICARPFCGSMSPVETPPGSVASSSGSGGRARAVYSIEPRPFFAVWPLVASHIRDAWQHQPGVEIVGINGNIRGFGLRTDECFIDARLSQGVDPELALPPALQILVGAGLVGQPDVYTLLRTDLVRFDLDEPLPSPGETFGETDLADLPGMIAGRATTLLVLLIVLLVLWKLS